MSLLSADFRLRATFSFPGGDVVVTDRADVGGELRVLSWGSIELPLDAGAEHCELRLSNLPIGGAPRFSSRWDALNPPEGVPVKIEWSHAAIGAAPTYTAFLVGSITEVSSVSEQEVTLHIGDALSQYERDIGDPITLSEFPQASPSALGKAKPIILGDVERWVPPIIRERKKTSLTASLLASAIPPFDLSVESNLGWPVTGTLKINDEHMTWDNTLLPSGTDDVLKINARGVNSTTAEAHDFGDQVTERALQKWLVSDHPCSAVSGVSSVSSAGKTTPLDPGLFTIDLGTGADYWTTVESTSLDEEKVPGTSDTPSYRRIDFDKVGTLINPGTFSTNTEAKNPAGCCGGLDVAQPDSYATITQPNGAVLPVQRDGAFTAPGTPFTKAWLVVEHFGLAQMGSNKIKLAVEASATATTLTVDKFLPFTTGPTSGLTFNYQIRIDKEDLLVTGGNEDLSLIFVTRGINGTTAAQHLTDTPIYKLTDFLSVGGAAAAWVPVYPELRVSYETGSGTTLFDTLGNLSDFSEIPPDIEEEEDAIIEAKAISGFHGHPVGDAAATAGIIPPSKTNLVTDALQSLGGLVVRTMLKKSAEDTKMGGPLSSKIAQRYRLDPTNSEKQFVRYGVWGLTGGIQGSFFQLIAGIRIRVVCAGVDGTALFRIEMRVGNTSKVIIFQSGNSAGVISTNNGPTIVEAGATFPTDSNGNQILLGHLYSTSTTINIFAESGRLDIYHVGVFVRFDQAQFIGNTESSISERSIHAGSFDLVKQKGGNYNNGVPGINSDFVVELMDSNPPYYLLDDNGVANPGYQVKSPGGSASGLVKVLANPPSGANALHRFDCYWTAIDADPSTEVLLIKVVMDLAIKAPGGSGDFETVKLVNDSTGKEFVSIGQLGPVIANPEQDWTRTTWSWTWVFDSVSGASKNTTVTVADLIANYRVRFAANLNALVGNELYVSGLTYQLELKTQTKVTQSEDASLFSRINFFDITDKVTTYDDVIGRRALVQFSKTNVLPDDTGKPVLVFRVYYVFEHFTAEDEPFEKIAVDAAGITLTDSVDAFRKVLTYGYPLLDAPASLIGEYTFGVAKASGALPVRGVIEETIPARDLLNRLAEQAKCSIYFWSGSPLAPASAIATLIFKPNTLTLSSPLFSFLSAGGDMLPDSFRLEYRTKDSVGNFVTVRAGKNYAKGDFEITAETQWTPSIAAYGRHPIDLDAEFLHSQEDAKSLALQLLQYRYEREIVARFDSPPTVKALVVPRGVIVQVVHAILSSTRAEVVGLRLTPGGLSEGLPPMIEISTVLRAAGIAGQSATTPMLAGDGT